MSTTIQNNASSPLGATPTATSPSSKTALDRDAFLKLLVAQMSHQDPLDPAKGTEFVAQLAQFSAVEQSVAQTQKLDLLSQQLASIGSNDAVSLVGQQVTIQAKQISFDGVTATGAGVTLSAPASNVSVSIHDATGKVVRTINVGARSQGPMPITWDGRDDNGQPLPAGSYGFDVTATAAGGGNVPVTQEVTGVVTKISFDKGYPEMLLDSGATAPISNLISVGAPPAAP
jgi:flagellar basal-body rod modification protein FlgD